jgi:RNA polymerase sigma-70 factor (ECF subfamily)
MLETDEERSTFAVFYEKHKGRCLKVALAITHNQSWAEDAVQEAFLKMIKQKEKYFSDPRKRTGTQIVIIVKGKAIEVLRREKRLDHSFLEDVENLTPDRSPNAFRIAAGKDAVERVKHLVSQLDDINQTIYEMKFLRQMADGEIAEEIGISKNAVAVRAHKLRKSIIGKLEAEDSIDV